MQLHIEGKIRDANIFSPKILTQSLNSRAMLHKKSARKKIDEIDTKVNFFIFSSWIGRCQLFVFQNCYCYRYYGLALICNTPNDLTHDPKNMRQMVFEISTFLSFLRSKQFQRKNHDKLFEKMSHSSNFLWIFWLSKVSKSQSYGVRC